MQAMYSSFGGSYIDEESMYTESLYMNNYINSLPTKFTPSTLPQGGYTSRYTENGVRIAQSEDSMYGYGPEHMYAGIWAGESERISQKSLDSHEYPIHHQEISSFRSIPALSTEFDDCSYLDNQFMADSTLSAFPSSCSEMGVYSNESSPLMTSYPIPSTPVTPATTPLLNGQIYTASGMPGPFVLIPMMARHQDGRITTVFVPKQTTVDTYMDLSVQTQIPYIEDMGYGNMPLQFVQEQPSPFSYVEEQQAQPQVEEIPEDDGPELVGMGLYDEPPELFYSNSTTPELANLQLNENGRGLVLEQSFGLPEEDEEEEEEYEIEEEEEEEDCNEQNDMTY